LLVIRPKPVVGVKGASNFGRRKPADSGGDPAAMIRGQPV
jgi:hypothetical protein